MHEKVGHLDGLHSVGLDSTCPPGLSTPQSHYTGSHDLAGMHKVAWRKGGRKGGRPGGGQGERKVHVGEMGGRKEIRRENCTQPFDHTVHHKYYANNDNLL